MREGEHYNAFLGPRGFTMGGYRGEQEHDLSRKGVKVQKIILSHPDRLIDSPQNRHQISLFEANKYNPLYTKFYVDGEWYKNITITVYFQDHLGNPLLGHVDDNTLFQIRQFLKREVMYKAQIGSLHQQNVDSKNQENLTKYGFIPRSTEQNAYYPRKN